MLSIAYFFLPWKNSNSLDKSIFFCVNSVNSFSISPSFSFVLINSTSNSPFSFSNLVLSFLKFSFSEYLTLIKFS